MRRLEWIIGQLAAGATLTGTFQAQALGVVSGQVISNTVAIVSEEVGAGVQASTAITISAAPCLGEVCAPTPTVEATPFRQGRAQFHYLGGVFLLDREGRVLLEEPQRERSVAPPLSRLGVRRPASTGHAHPTTTALASTVSSAASAAARLIFVSFVCFVVSQCFDHPPLPVSSPIVLAPRNRSLVR